MTEGNICRSLSIRSICLMELLITVCAIVMCVSTLEIQIPHNYQHVAYEDVLETKAHQIQSDVSQLHDDEYIDLVCHHPPVYTGDSTKIVIFVWASDRETHAMRRCIYQEMKRIGKSIQYSNISTVLDTSAKFLCSNRSVKASAWHAKQAKLSEVMHTINNRGIYEIRHGIILRSFYVNDLENDGAIVRETAAIHFNDNAIFNVTSQITVRLLNAAKRRMWTFVCNSIQLTWNDTGKLRQRFFSLVGNSAEVVVRSFRTGSASVSLYFDVLTLNASRPGLLNHSVTELLSLSDLHVSCIKLDQYGLSNETNEIIYTNVTEEITVRTKSLLINNKLQIRVNVSVPIVSDHSFGEYFCATYCKLQTNNSNETLYGCIQKKNFFIILDSWRTDNLLYRQENKYCKDFVNSITETYKTDITNVSKMWKETTDSCITEYKKCNEATHYCITGYKTAKRELASKNIITFASSVLLTILSVSAIIISLLLVHFLRQLNYLKTLNSLQSVLQSTENTEERNMKYDVFLSYSSKDRLWVESTLLNFIESKGFKVCFDERDFLIGCNLVETIAKAVYESRKVIAVVSPDYLSSRWCIQFEFLLTYTRILNKEAPFNSLLPIKYRNCHIPEHMNCLKYLDYTTVTDACDRSVIVKILSKLWFYKQPDIEPTREAQFFDDLLSWLRQPQVVEQLP